MKLRKSISKFLTLSMLINNIHFCSNASILNSKALNRYETLEGEVITLDDVEEDDITEIEIFGNTIQDENNLEDIQSVGELYVNEKGEPILDSLGREQYKIEINSCNSNLNQDNSLYTESAGIFSSTIDGYKVEGQHNQVHLYYELPLNGYTEVTVKAEMIKKSSSYENSTPLVEWWVDNEWGYERLYFKDNQINKCITSSKITSQSKKLKIRIGIQKGDFDYGYAVFDNISISYGNTEHIPYEESELITETILLPYQLQKINHIADRLYWDNEKCRYVIEKKIFKWVITATESSWRKHIDYTPGEGFSGFNFTTNQIFSEELLPKNFGLRLGNNGFGNSAGHTSQKRGTDFHNNGNGKLLIEENLVPNDSLELLKEWLENNYSYIYYELKEPLHIETNITEKIKVPIHKSITHIFTQLENKVNPTLKVTIDRLKQVSQDAVDLAVSAPTSSNIALARMYLNLLSESIYKDQLQEQLNQLFSSDMVLERQSVTANLDVYIKSENMLSMSLDTNNITFEEYSGVEELELQDAINISINSSLPYSLNAYVVGDITNNDNSQTMDLDALNIKENSEVDYQKFDRINSKIVLKDNCSKGNNLNHIIDLKLSSNNAHKADIYKTIIKFEAEQK